MSDTRRAFADICRGYSTLSYQGNSLYIKHLSHIDQVDLDEYTARAKEEGKKKGLSSIEEKLVWLDKRKLWLKKDEEGIEKAKKALDNMRQTRGKLFLPSDKKSMDLLIHTNEQKWIKLANRRGALLGKTQERYSQDKTLVYYMQLSLFKDKMLTQPALSPKQSIDDDELNEMLAGFNTAMEPFEEKGIKRIAVSDTFTSYFFNCGEDVNSFFENCVSRWSFNQLNLVFWGRYFKNVLQSGSNIPKDIMSDPDKLIDFITGAAKAKEIVSQGPKRGYGDGSGTQFVGIVGSSQDLKDLGINTEQNTAKFISDDMLR